MADTAQAGRKNDPSPGELGLDVDGVLDGALLGARCVVDDPAVVGDPLAGALMEALPEGASAPTTVRISSGSPADASRDRNRATSVTDADVTANDAEPPARAAAVTSNTVMTVEEVLMTVCIGAPNVGAVIAVVVFSSQEDDFSAGTKCKLTGPLKR